MTECIMCWGDSRGHKYCYHCSDRRSNICSVINQNKKKLIKLCSWRTNYSDEWKFKFYLYTGNIKDWLKELEVFNRAEEEFIKQYNKEKEDE